MVDEEELREWFSNAERIVVAGIGNPIRMDDFAGVKIVRDLRGKVSENVCLIECETLPESFIQQIVDFNPTHVLLIDAAFLGIEPGDSVLTEPGKLGAFPAISTHALPLGIFCDFLARNTTAKIAILLIEPKQVDFGENLTPVMEDSARRIIDLLIKILPQEGRQN